MDSISFFMPASSSSFGNSVSYQRKGFSKLLSAKDLFHLDSPKQELRVHAWCQQMNLDSRKSKTFGTTMSVMEKKIQSQLRQGVHTKVSGSWNQVQLLPVHVHACVPMLQQDQDAGENESPHHQEKLLYACEHVTAEKVVATEVLRRSLNRQVSSGLSGSMCSSRGSSAAKSSLDAPSDNG